MIGRPYFFLFGISVPQYFFPFSRLFSYLLLILCFISFLLFPCAINLENALAELHISYSHTERYYLFFLRNEMILQSKICLSKTNYNNNNNNNNRLIVITAEFVIIIFLYKTGNGSCNSVSSHNLQKNYFQKQQKLRLHRQQCSTSSLCQVGEQTSQPPTLCKTDDVDNCKSQPRADEISNVHLSKCNDSGPNLPTTPVVNHLNQTRDTNTTLNRNFDQLEGSSPPANSIILEDEMEHPLVEANTNPCEDCAQDLTVDLNNSRSISKVSVAATLEVTKTCLNNFYTDTSLVNVANRRSHDRLEVSSTSSDDSRIHLSRSLPGVSRIPSPSVGPSPTLSLSRVNNSLSPLQRPANNVNQANVKVTPTQIPSPLCSRNSSSVQVNCNKVSTNNFNKLNALGQKNNIDVISVPTSVLNVTSDVKTNQTKKTPIILGKLDPLQNVISISSKNTNPVGKNVHSTGSGPIRRGGAQILPPSRLSLTHKQVISSKITAGQQQSSTTGASSSTAIATRPSLTPATRTKCFDKSKSGVLGSSVGKPTMISIVGAIKKTGMAVKSNMMTSDSITSTAAVRPTPATYKTLLIQPKVVKPCNYRVTTNNLTNKVSSETTQIRMNVLPTVVTASRLLKSGGSVRKSLLPSVGSNIPSNGQPGIKGLANRQVLIEKMLNNASDKKSNEIIVKNTFNNDKENCAPEKNLLPNKGRIPCAVTQLRDHAPEASGIGGATTQGVPQLSRLRLPSRLKQPSLIPK